MHEEKIYKDVFLLTGVRLLFLGILLTRKWVQVLVCHVFFFNSFYDCLVSEIKVLHLFVWQVCLLVGFPGCQIWSQVSTTSRLRLNHCMNIVLTFHENHLKCPFVETMYARVRLAWFFKDFSHRVNKQNKKRLNLLH